MFFLHYFTKTKEVSTLRFSEKHISDDYGHVTIRAYHSSVQPGDRGYREHHHTECELSLFLAGNGVYAVGEQRYEFSAGDVFLFGSNEAHCITSVQSDLDLLNFQFEPRILWEHPENAELLSLFTARNKHYQHRIAQNDRSLNGILLSLEGEIEKKATGYAVQVKYLLFSALIHIMRQYDYIDTKRAVNAPSAATGSLSRAIHYINEHLDGRLTLKEIAEVACMTPTYFSAVFKKFNGVSPWEYITIKRVEKAVEMLKATELTKLEIAERCGFSSSSNFYKSFFQVTGKRPSDYVFAREPGKR
ncbi:MAG: helix-turn-helix domain-containing protein [Ruminococcaceae bacterium]|nr:helix-turn-helix domain-containing protein [Oscillospiraceae bacterium]